MTMDNDLRMRLHVATTGLHVAAAGHLDTSTAYLLTELVGAALTRYPTKILTIDTAAVHYIDSAGVAALTACQREAASRDVRFALTNLPPLLRWTIIAYDPHGQLTDAITAATPPDTETLPPTAARHRRLCRRLCRRPPRPRHHR
jgi:anti-anti-sigma factor